MKNKAKCKKCKSIIESFHATDYVLCSCGEISVDGGDALRCTSKDWENFLRVDDEGNEIIPKIIDKTDSKSNEESSQFKQPATSKKELMNLLDEMIQNIEKLPQQAMTTSINHYDFVSLLILLSTIFRSDCKEES